MSAITYPEAAVVGLLQGVAELFPVSSLGHSVLLPALIGGSWARDLNVRSAESPYLAFIVGLHVATAVALVAYFWRDWVRIVGGLLTSIRDREVRTSSQKLAWLLILATIPVGIVGLLLEHTFRTTLSKPTPTAAFLLANGVILLAIEAVRRRVGTPAPVGTGGSGQPNDEAVDASRDQPDDERARGEFADRRLSRLPVRHAVAIGSAQIGALLPGISRSGVTMAAGLVDGLDHEDAARFSFLLATPVIAAAGLLKLPDLFGPLGNGIHGQILLGSVLSGVGAYLSVRFLVRYFRSNSLRPYGVYCLLAGAASLIYFLVR